MLTRILILVFISLPLFAAYQPKTEISGTVQVSLANTGANATAVKVDGSAVTQPISGTITANLGTIADVATESTLSTLNGKVTAVNTGAISGTVTLNGISLVSGTVSQNGAWSVSVANTPTVSTTGTIPISGAVTINGTPSVSTTGTIPISIAAEFSSNAGVSTTAAANTNFTLKTSNTSRRGLQIMNMTDVNCWIKFGTTATSATSTIYMLAGAYYNMPKPIYTGQIDGICSANPTSGQLNVTELQ